MRDKNFSPRELLIFGMYKLAANNCGGSSVSYSFKSRLDIHWKSTTWENVKAQGRSSHHWSRITYHVKSNISKRYEIESVNGSYRKLYGFSNGEIIFDPKWLLKVKPWKLWSRIFQKTVRDKEKRSSFSLSRTVFFDIWHDIDMPIESMNSLLWRPTELYLRGAKNWGTLLFQSTVDIHIQNQTLKSNISKMVREIAIEKLSVNGS